MALEERLVLLLAATHAEESVLGVKPSLHTQTLSDPAWELAGQSLTHDFLLSPNFWLSSQDAQATTPSFLAHVLQPVVPAEAHVLQVLAVSSM